LLRSVADLDEHSGEIFLDDINQQSISAHLWRKKIALLSAETSWWFDTVEEHFDVFPEPQLNELGFSENCSQWSIARLSSGEKQRLGLLRMLENKPDVLLLDEPTANLDNSNANLFENFVMRYLASQSACAIWVSHDHEQLQRMCQFEYSLNNGELVNAN
jgi:UDP-glucose/iron transport system ATP-binding protein